MNHPCNDYTCPEWCHGQCFGSGCKANPMPESEVKSDVETDN